MAEISVTASQAVTGSALGDLVSTSGAGFNHAALVTAGRSRSDGYDFWMYHTTRGPVPLVSIVGANTSACYVTFNFVAALGALDDPDTGYRLVFGDLGSLTSRATAAAGPNPATASATYSVPSITIPPPSFPMTQVSAYETKAVEYPDFAVFRRADLNENRRTFVQAEWRDVSPEDWYEIRAVVRASRGGVGTVSPSWLTGSYRVRPGTPSFTQDTKGKFSASMELEQALI